MCLAVSCGRYSPDEIVSTYEAYEQGIDQVDTDPIETWAEESEQAVTDIVDDLQKANEMLEDITQQIEAWNTLPDQELINSMILYWSNHENTPQGDWIKQFPSWL